MTTQQLESSYNVTNSTNQGFNSAPALKLRLDSTIIIENLELFLRCAKIITEKDEQGRIFQRMVTFGIPKANEIGISSILNEVQLILNPQVVQGNFPSDSPGHSSMYEDYIINLRIDLTCHITENCYNWGVLEGDINVIIDEIMNLIEPFMTRLIDNKERDSYANTIRHSEASQVRDLSQENKLKVFS